MDGGKILAKWRESGEWWAGDPPKEYVRYIDPSGIRREKSRVLTSTAIPKIEPLKDDPREDYDFRIHKRRDEKVAQACGLIKAPNLPKKRQSTTSTTLLYGMTGYSFGRSVLIAEELAAHSAARGHSSALIADRFSMAGVYEFASTAVKVGIKPLIGALIELECGGEVVLIAKNKNGFRSISRLITECHLNEPRSYPLCNVQRLETHSDGVLMLTAGDSSPINRSLVRRNYSGARQWVDVLTGIYGRENCLFLIERSYLPWELDVNRNLIALARDHHVTCVAGGPVTHLDSSMFPAQDVVTCVDTLCLIEEIEGRKPQRTPPQTQPHLPPRRALNAERYLRSNSELINQFKNEVELIHNANDIAIMCDDRVFPQRTELPKIDENEPFALTQLAHDGARKRCKFFDGRYKARLSHELERINRLGYSGHFLIAADLCRWAKDQNILFSGRGSVVDSFVAYCLGFSRINACDHNLHFDRFLPEDSTKRPDIDIDFEAAKRNDVRNYVTNKYGADHVATVAAFGAYRSRGIIRDVGKVLGIPIETLQYLSKRLHGSITPDRLREAIDSRPELKKSNIPIERLEWVFALASQLMDVPMNIRAHSSGVVISRESIRDTVPVMLSADEDVPIIQWDKRTAKYYFDKFDILCLRGNDVLSGTQCRVKCNNHEFDIEALPLDDEDTFRAMRSGELIGIPQSASPAMRQAHVRLRTQNLDDASLVQAGIRPGVGGAVKINELIARKRGKPFDYSHPNLEAILGNTYGIIVFQEQVDQLLTTFGKYTSDEAENVRESIYKKRRESFAAQIRDEVISRIVTNGYEPNVAEEVYAYVAGFQGYGFAQGHALAFAEVSIRSIWCQQNYPAEYFAALLDAQPAGYYGPCTLVNEARSRGVKVLPPDVNISTRKYLVEDVLSDQAPHITLPNAGIRVPLTQISGLSINTQHSIVHNRIDSDYISFFDFVARARPARDELQQLILSGACDSLHTNRRAMLWEIQRAIEFADMTRSGESKLPLDWSTPHISPDIIDFDEHERVIRERLILDLDVHRHLMSYERERVSCKGGITSSEAKRLPDRSKAFVVGHPIRLRFPPTSSGKRVLFFDLEDETGLLNVTCFDDVYQKYGHVIVCSPYITIIGESQDRDGHTAFLAHHIHEYHPIITRKFVDNPSIDLPFVTNDFLVGG